MTNYYKLPLEFDHPIYIHTYFREFNGPDGDVCLSHDAIVERVHQVEPRLNEINDWNQAEERKRERERERERAGTYGMYKKTIYRTMQCFAFFSVVLAAKARSSGR